MIWNIMKAFAPGLWVAGLMIGGIVWLQDTLANSRENRGLVRPLEKAQARQSQEVAEVLRFMREGR